MGSVSDPSGWERSQHRKRGAATAQAAATRLEDPDFSSSKWYFSRDELEKFSPSRKDNIDAKKEAQYRRSYCGYLQELGLRLKMPQITIATAIVFCHRFFTRQSHARNDRFMVATVSMFLSGKVEETPRPAKDVVCVGYMLRHKKKIPTTEDYNHQLALLLAGEKLLLETLAFDLNISHPYRAMVLAVKQLDKSLQSHIAQVAWNFINDGLRSTLFLQFKPHLIAAGAIFLAGKFMRKKLPSDGDKAWWRAFQVAPRQLEEVSNQMLEQYEKPEVIVARSARPTGGSIDTPPSGQVSTQTEAHDTARDEVSKKASSSPGEVVSGKRPEVAAPVKKEAMDTIDEAKLKAALEKRRKSRAAPPPKQAVVTDEELLERELENGIEVARKEKTKKAEAGGRHRADHRSLKRQRGEEAAGDANSKHPEVKRERRSEVVSGTDRSDIKHCDDQPELVLPENKRRAVIKTEEPEVVLPERNRPQKEAVTKTEEPEVVLPESNSDMDVAEKSSPDEKVAEEVQPGNDRKEDGVQAELEERRERPDEAAAEMGIVSMQVDVIVKEERSEEPEVVEHPGDGDTTVAGKEENQESAKNDAKMDHPGEKQIDEKVAAKAKPPEVKREPPKTEAVAAKRSEKRDRPAEEAAAQKPGDGVEPANKRKKPSEDVPSKQVPEQQQQQPPPPPPPKEEAQEEEEGELRDECPPPRSPPRPVSRERRMVSPHHDRPRAPPPLPPPPFVPYETRPYERRREYQQHSYPRREPFFDRQQHHHHQQQHQANAGFRHHRGGSGGGGGGGGGGDYYASPHHHHFPPQQPPQQHYNYHQQQPREMEWHPHQQHHHHHRLLPPPPPQPPREAWIDRESKRARYDSR